MKHILLLLLGLVLTLSAQAVPAKPGTLRWLTLRDGSRVLCELRGDEFCHFWQAKDGRRFVRIEADTLYQPADIAALETQARPLRQRASERRARRLVQAQAPAATRSTNLGGPHPLYTGHRKGLIILVQFKDVKFKPGHDNAFYQRVANELNFTHPLGFLGSLRDYFLSQSNGQFELDFDVAGPYTMPKEAAYYGENANGRQDARIGQMLSTALRQADEDVDFSQYDWGGNGMVDQVYFLYAGKGEASGGDENTIWPHEYSLQYTDFGHELLLDGVGVDTYACGCETTVSYSYSPSGKVTTRERTDGIGTICHEFSHCLGLPDVYDTQNNRLYGMNRWDVMDQGNYNGDSYSPSAYTGYERIYCGWVDPVVLSTPTSVRNMRSSADYGQPMIIYNQAHPDEYYILENRQQQSWDRAQLGHGLLITHVDYSDTLWSFNVLNSVLDYSNVRNDHARMTIIPADNNLTNSAVGVAGDPWPWTAKDGTLVDALTNESTPAATLYNANTDGQLLMNAPITNIVENPDGTISFDFMGGSSANVVDGLQPVALTPRTGLPAEGLYDLMGRRAGGAPQRHGVFIQAGRKVIR